jgi:prevent-host-death family protein
MPREILISEFKAHCIAELKRVNRTRQPLIVTLRGKPLARVEPVSSPDEPPVRLDSRRGRVSVKRDLVRFDFTDEWEMNR